MNAPISSVGKLLVLGLSTAVVSLSMSCGTSMQSSSAQSDSGAEDPGQDDATQGDGVQDESTQTDLGQTDVPLSDDGRPVGWAEETHSNDVAADYAVVFPEGKVNRLDITITPEDWQAMQDDMSALYGEPGRIDAGMLPPPGAAEGAPEVPPRPAEAAPGQPGGGAGQVLPPGGSLGTVENPIWVPCTVEFEGNTWWYVGIRFKGQSSLSSTWSSSIGKLPLRFDFDEFEDEHPEIDNQRFFGFKKLSLASNFKDSSLLREKVGHDIFRDAGIPAPRTAFYRVYIDNGEGSTYFGLYTMTEIPDDPMLVTHFGNDDGNLYKPTSTWVWFNEEDFDKETNQGDEDWSDVEAAITALHADRSDAAVWRAGLEAVLDVDAFLHWLAVNTVIQNWDTYGVMAQNYYLYADSEDGGRLRWIPWDNNESLKSGDGTQRSPLSLQLAEVGDDWPLIRYLADDPTYWADYVSYMGETVEGAFAVEATQQRYRAAHDLIAPYVTGAEGEQPGYTLLANPQDFYDELDYLLDHVVQRREAVLEFLEDIP